MTIGLLCFDHAYAVLRDRRAAGRLTGYVEAALAANPGLADLGFLIPRLTVVQLPEFVIPDDTSQTKRLWDE